MNAQNLSQNLPSKNLNDGLPVAEKPSPKVTIYADGSCLKNGSESAQAGAGIVLVSEDRSKEKFITQESLAEPILNVEDIQGNILAGFNKTRQVLLFITINDESLAKAWLKKIMFKIANLDETIKFKKLYKKMKARRGFNLGVLQSTWINIAFSFDGLKKLKSDADEFVDEAFKQGMHNRSLELGDPLDKTSEGNCKNWLVGNQLNIPDIILIVASDTEERLNLEIETIKKNLNSGLKIIYRENSKAPSAPFSAHEHFGFRDGVSQPGIRGRLSYKLDDFLTQRENPNNPNQGKPGQDLVWPGEFVFGYPGQSPTNKTAPGLIIEAGPKWAKNGAFLVFRRYRQDVDRFKEFIESVAQKLIQENPAFSGMTADKLGAKLVGRWMSGTPILRAPDEDMPSIAQSSCTDNHFNFVYPSHPVNSSNGNECADNVFPQAIADDLGIICPHAAHIRKAYPRDDLTSQDGEALVQTHRMIRRGIPFGTPGEGECGLLFLSYQTSIERQFEFVIRNWFNNPDFRNSGVGHDPIVGQNSQSNTRERFFNIPIKASDGKIENIKINIPFEFVTPTGGGYFFAPSISALKYLAS